MIYIKPFIEITMNDANIFGGKVASLGEMLRIGLPVPDGFGISIEAHKEFIGKDFHSEFEIELYKAYQNINAQYVAVRSSAIAEDSGDASWAGQLESYLNITEPQLRSSIRLCWESINSTQAKAYAKDKNLSANDLLVGVAVQSMLIPECAGVMFTANPVTGNQDQIMIEGSYGLGEMVVQGAVSPDNYIVSKSDMSVIEFSIAVKKNMMIYDRGKNRVILVAENKTDRSILRENKILELSSIGLNIEKHYGRPMDIEWAYQAGKFYIVQARPITTIL